MLERRGLVLVLALLVAAAGGAAAVACSALQPGQYASAARARTRA